MRIRCTTLDENSFSEEMRNEMDIRLKWLHKAVKCSRFFLVKAEIFLSLMETGE
jgi:hypothetical protein